MQNSFESAFEKYLTDRSVDVCQENKCESGTSTPKTSTSSSSGKSKEKSRKSDTCKRSTVDTVDTSLNLSKEMGKKQDGSSSLPKKIRHSVSSSPESSERRTTRSQKNTPEGRTTRSRGGSTSLTPPLLLKRNERVGRSKIRSKLRPPSPPTKSDSSDGDESDTPSPVELLLANRPKRQIIPKSLDTTAGLSWREETQLQKALLASLHETKVKSSIMGIQSSEKSIVMEDAPPVTLATIIGRSKSQDQSKTGRENLKLVMPDPDHKPSDSGGQESNGSSNSKHSSSLLYKSHVRAQRKFAQGSRPSSPNVSPVKEANKTPVKSNTSKACLLPMKPTAKTEDFLTFLCLRGTPYLPPHLEFFNSVDSENLVSCPNTPKSSRPATPASALDTPRTKAALSKSRLCESPAPQSRASSPDLDISLDSTELGVKPLGRVARATASSQPQVMATSSIPPTSRQSHTTFHKPRLKNRNPNQRCSTSSSSTAKCFSVSKRKASLSPTSFRRSSGRSSLLKKPCHGALRMTARMTCDTTETESDVASPIKTREVGVSSNQSKSPKKGTHDVCLSPLAKGSTNIITRSSKGRQTRSTSFLKHYSDFARSYNSGDMSGISGSGSTSVSIGQKPAATISIAPEYEEVTRGAVNQVTNNVDCSTQTPFSGFVDSDQVEAQVELSSNDDTTCIRMSSEHSSSAFSSETSTSSLTKKLKLRNENKKMTSNKCMDQPKMDKTHVVLDPPPFPCRVLSPASSSQFSKLQSSSSLRSLVQTPASVSSFSSASSYIFTNTQNVDPLNAPRLKPVLYNESNKSLLQNSSCLQNRGMVVKVVAIERKPIATAKSQDDANSVEIKHVDDEMASIRIKCEDCPCCRGKCLHCLTKQPTKTCCMNNRKNTTLDYTVNPPPKCPPKVQPVRPIRVCVMQPKMKRMPKKTHKTILATKFDSYNRKAKNNPIKYYKADLNKPLLACPTLSSSTSDDSIKKTLNRKPIQYYPASTLTPSSTSSSCGNIRTTVLKSSAIRMPAVSKSSAIQKPVPKSVIQRPTIPKSSAIQKPTVPKPAIQKLTVPKSSVTQKPTVPKPAIQKPTVCKSSAKQIPSVPKSSAIPIATKLYFSTASVTSQVMCDVPTSTMSKFDAFSYLPPSSKHDDSLFENMCLEGVKTFPLPPVIDLATPTRKPEPSNVVSPEVLVKKDVLLSSAAENDKDSELDTPSKNAQQGSSSTSDEREFSKPACPSAECKSCNVINSSVYSTTYPPSEYRPSYPVPAPPGLPWNYTNPTHPDYNANMLPRFIPPAQSRMPLSKDQNNNAFCSTNLESSRNQSNNSNTFFKKAPPCPFNPAAFRFANCGLRYSAPMAGGVGFGGSQCFCHHPWLCSQAANSQYRPTLGPLPPPVMSTGMFDLPSRLPSQHLPPPKSRYFEDKSGVIISRMDTPTVLF